VCLRNRSPSGLLQRSCRCPAAAGTHHLPHWSWSCTTRLQASN